MIREEILKSYSINITQTQCFLVFLLLLPVYEPHKVTKLMENRYFTQMDLEMRLSIVEKVKVLAEKSFSKQKCVRQGGIIVKEIDGKMKIIGESEDNRLENELEHAAMNLINQSAGLCDYILTGLEGEN